MMTVVSSFAALSPLEIVNLFYGGCSVKQLTNRVAAAENISKQTARTKVESVLYLALKKCSVF